MKSYALLSALAVASLGAPAANIHKRDTPRLYLAGDSTMALGGGGTGTQGWGVYLPYSFTNLTIINSAIAGRSARSYTTEGHFTTLINAVSPGDYVIIEFGHNDGGSLSKDNGRSDCVGSGNQTCTTTAGVVVQTYVTYLSNAAKALVDKGAKVVISSPTPDNICESGTCSYSPSRFTGYCKVVVSNVGQGVSFVDHGLYVADRYEKLGSSVVNAFYPNDHTHTSPEGADVVAKAFVKGLLCAGDKLGVYSRNSTENVEGSCL